MGFLGEIFRGMVVPTANTAYNVYKSGIPGKMIIGSGFGAGAGIVDGFDKNSDTSILRSIGQGALLGAAVGGGIGATGKLGKEILRLNEEAGLKNVLLDTGTQKIWNKIKHAESQLAPDELLSKALQKKKDAITGKAFGQSPLVAAAKGAAYYSPGVAWGAGKGILQSTMHGAKTVARHPYVTMGVLGGGYFATSTIMHNHGPTSPTLSGATVNTQYDQQQIAAMSIQSGMMPTGQVGSYPRMQKPMHRALQNSTTNLVQGLHRGRHG